MGSFGQIFENISNLTKAKTAKKQKKAPGRPKKNSDLAARYNRKGNYRTKYEHQDMEDALAAVMGGMPVKQAARQFHVPRTTLQGRAKGNHGEKLGGPTILSPDEEKEIALRLVTFGDWGFPLTTLDLRNMVKAYLDKQGKSTRNNLVSILAIQNDLNF